MNKETYAEAFEVWHKSDPVLRGDYYYDVLEFMQDADREVKRLREKLEAAAEDMKQMDAYIAESDDPYAALCEVCKYKPQHGGKCKRCDVHDNVRFEWRGRQEGEKG